MNHRTPSALLATSAFLMLTGSLTAMAASSSAPCRFAESGNTVLDEASRKACLAQAKISDLEPITDPEQVARGPMPNEPLLRQLLTSGGPVSCRWHFETQGGTSRKFRCHATDAKGTFFTKKGELAPEALSVGASDTEREDELFLDAEQTQPLKIDGKKAEALDLKVRYTHPQSRRDVENYTTTAASHLFWAMGFPTDMNYMTESVSCIDCSADPFGKNQKTPASGQQSSFADASIETKYGKVILKRGWSFQDLAVQTQNSQKDAPVQRAELEALALATQLVSSTSNTNAQNDLVCAKGGKQDDGTCTKPIALIHDLGAGFGHREKPSLNLLFFKIDTGIAPRGDLKAYQKKPIFKRGRGCMLTDKPARALQTISEEGRQEFLRRAAGLTPSSIRAILARAKFGHADRALLARLKKEQPTLSDEQLETKSLDLWTQAVLARLDEIRTADCRVAGR